MGTVQSGFQVCVRRQAHLLRDVGLAGSLAEAADFVVDWFNKHVRS